MSKSRNFQRLCFLLILSVFCCCIPVFALAAREEAAGAEVLPIAENLTISTYKNVAVCGTLAAVHPQGVPLTFQVTKNPARGALEFTEDGAPQFTYTPYENKTGKDSFTYVAKDEKGNTSRPATVSIKISKPDTKVTYADMNGHPAHKAAIALAETEAFVGDRMGDGWFFRPALTVTREEFLAMAMDVVGVETLPEATLTGFCDDDSISVWAKPYVASALRFGMVQGCMTGAEGTAFAPDRTITQTEAAVMLNRLLKVSDVAADGTFPQESTPAWAYQSMVNLEAVGVLAPETDGTLALSGELTRADAAMLLLSAQELLEFRQSAW